MSSRGVRAGVGPRVARVHVGGGYRAGFSTGAGPFTAYHSVGGRRRAPSRAKRRRSARTAGSGNYRAQLQDDLKQILYLHRGSFPAVQAPVAPPIDEVDERAIKRRHQRAGTKGASWFARAERARARENALAAAQEEIDATKAQRQEQRATLQAGLDARWRALVENDADAVLSALQEGFQGTGAALELDSNSLSIVVPAPGLDVVPEHAPAVTPTGRPSLRKMTKTERNNLYDEVLCGHLLAAVRKTLAVAPGIEDVWAGMVRTGEHGVGVERRAECLLVARLYRKDLVDVRWDETTSATILHARASEVAVHRFGRAGEFRALDPGSHPLAYQVAKRVDINDDGTGFAVRFLSHRKKVPAAGQPAQAGPAGPPAVTRTPRNQAELEALLRLKPLGWEHLYYAGRLLQERDAIEDKYRDYLCARAVPTGEAFPLRHVDRFVDKALAEAKELSGILRVVTSKEVQQAAFGAPGQPGDPARIADLAKRYNDMYEGFLDWVAKVRSANAPAECRHALELLTKLGENPVHDYRAYVDQVVSQLDRLPAATAAGERFNATFHLVLTGASHDVVAEFRKERARLEGLLREENAPCPPSA